MPRRKRLRLQGFDYALPWHYFVTVCASRRGHVFGRVEGERVRLNSLGETVVSQLEKLPGRVPGVTLDTSVVMPDHVHAILILNGSVRLGTAVALFKAGTSRAAGKPVWQRGYWDRIIRDEREYGEFREYIRANPERWSAGRGL